MPFAADVPQPMWVIVERATDNANVHFERGDHCALDKGRQVSVLGTDAKFGTLIVSIPTRDAAGTMCGEVIAFVKGADKWPPKGTVQDAEQKEYAEKDQAIKRILGEDK